MSFIFLYFFSGSDIFRSEIAIHLAEVYFLAYFAMFFPFSIQIHFASQLSRRESSGLIGTYPEVAYFHSFRVIFSKLFLNEDEYDEKN